MRVNVVITTYAGNYSIVDKRNYLKYNLTLLNKIKTNVAQITIMKPKVNIEHSEYLDYYDLDSIDISNIKNRIKIIECENSGISYGQFLNAAINYSEFDYYIFVEDDYVIFMDYFEEYLVSELNKKPENSFLCLFYFHSKQYKLLESMQNETNEIASKLLNIMYSNNLDINSSFYTPDFSLGIISRQSVDKIQNRFGGCLTELLSINYKQLFMHQIFFGYILFTSGIEIHDLSEKNVNLFYHTGGNVTLCNFDSDIQKWKEYPYNGEKMNIPVFAPIEFFHPFKHDESMPHIKKYLIDYELFVNQFNLLNNEMIRLTLLFEM
jgi:hypothetical protein